jgi:hypothetical protein
MEVAESTTRRRRNKDSKGTAGKVKVSTDLITTKTEEGHKLMHRSSPQNKDYKRVD